MKKSILLTLALCLSMLLVVAQSPTLDETISYIKKRVEATEGHQIIWSNGSGNYVMTPKFYCSGSSAAASSYMNGANKFTHGSDPIRRDSP